MVIPMQTIKAWKYSSMHIHLIEVSIQLHALVTLPPRNSLQYHWIVACVDSRAILDTSGEWKTSCMYVYVCMYVRMYVCMYVCTYVRTHARTHACMNAYIHTHACIHTYIHTYTCMHTYICTQTHTHRT